MAAHCRYTGRQSRSEMLSVHGTERSVRNTVSIRGMTVCQKHCRYKGREDLFGIPSVHGTRHRTRHGTIWSVWSAIGSTDERGDQNTVGAGCPEIDATFYRVQ